MGRNKQRAAQIRKRHTQALLSCCATCAVDEHTNYPTCNGWMKVLRQGRSARKGLAALWHTTATASPSPDICVTTCCVVPATASPHSSHGHRSSTAASRQGYRRSSFPLTESRPRHSRSPSLVARAYHATNDNHALQMRTRPFPVGSSMLFLRAQARRCHSATAASRHQCGHLHRFTPHPSSTASADLELVTLAIRSIFAKHWHDGHAFMPLHASVVAHNVTHTKMTVPHHHLALRSPYSPSTNRRRTPPPGRHNGLALPPPHPRGLDLPHPDTCSSFSAPLLPPRRPGARAHGLLYYAPCVLRNYAAPLPCCGAVLLHGTGAAARMVLSLCLCRSGARPCLCELWTTA